jgi:hypothetical protein
LKKIISWEFRQFPFNRINENLEEVPNKLTVYDEDEQEHDIPMLMQTPLGLYAVNDSMNPYKNYEVRIGDTNFELTNQICNAIERQDGVEVFKKLGRYKFVIGLGKLFDFADVRRAIERDICDVSDVEFQLSQIQDAVIVQNVSKILTSLQNKKYFVYLFPNGNIEYVENSEEEFNEKAEKFAECLKLSNGIMFTNV